MAAPRAQRADARRNIAAILDAATDCLARDPEMSIAGIAAAAGVGRITLYGHFKTRADLVDAVLVRIVGRADAILDATDTSGDPAGALARLVESSWQLVHQFRNILLAAQRELPAERIRGVHDRILRRVQSLIEQGQHAGTFRRDMPQQWLITTTYSLMHAAAEDAAAGRLDAGDAAGLITATLLAAFTPTRADHPARSARISTERRSTPPASARNLPRKPYLRTSRHPAEDLRSQHRRAGRCCQASLGSGPSGTVAVVTFRFASGRASATRNRLIAASSGFGSRARLSARYQYRSQQADRATGRSSPARWCVRPGPAQVAQLPVSVQERAWRAGHAAGEDPGVVVDAPGCCGQQRRPFGQEGPSGRGGRHRSRHLGGGEFGRDVVRCEEPQPLCHGG